jgi:flagellar motor switch protein FliM
VSTAAEVLNQEEIDALLKSVDNQEVPAGDGTSVPGIVRSYDLASEVRAVRGRLPALELINERFARLLRAGLYQLIQREAEVALLPMRVMTQVEFVHTLQAPASMNLVRLAPLRGTALFVLDAALVSAVVDHYFGGAGRPAAIAGRPFTPAEQRVITMVLQQVFSDLSEAWQPVAPLTPEFVSAESDPQFLVGADSTEVVLVNSFRITLEGGGGELHLSLPHSMIEPIRAALDAGAAPKRTDGAEFWTRQLREDLEDVEVQLVPVLGHASLTVGGLLALKPGDVIPCDFDGQVTLSSGGMPLLRGAYGASRGQQAVKVVSRIQPRKQAK